MLPCASTTTLGSVVLVASSVGKKKRAPSPDEGFDEPPPEAIWSELAARVLRQRGRIAITLTPIGLPLGWLRKLVEAGEVEDIHTSLTVEATTPIGGRPLLTKQDIDKLEAQVLPQERAQRIHGEWSPIMHGVPDITIWASWAVWTFGGFALARNRLRHLPVTR